MLRVRELSPPPHATLHALHSAHESTMQFTGHDCSLQGLVSNNPGHCIPPCKGCTTTLRAMPDVPPPHVALHSVSGPQPETSQSTGQGSVMHVPSSTSARHSAPPYSGTCVTVRLRKYSPPPHAASQLLHEPQLETRQSTGHPSGWQGSSSSVTGHGVPPQKAARVIGRVRPWRPPPHVAEHSPQDVQSPVVQCTGQQLVLHVCSS